MMDSIPINERDIHMKFKPDYLIPESPFSPNIVSQQRHGFTGINLYYKLRILREIFAKTIFISGIGPSDNNCSL